MIIETSITLKDGRTVDSSSIEFRERLPISADLLDSLALTRDGDLYEVISAIARGVVAL